MPLPIRDVAKHMGLLDEELTLYGEYKAKIHLIALERLASRPQGKLIVVTAITPTPAGEGKTVTTIGLGDALRRVGERATVCIREPSLGPVFGVKGGGTGGGKAQAYPADDINLHFTGDIHAVTAAHNLLAAMIEAHIHHGNAKGFDVHGVWWNRVLDVPDRSLRKVITGLGGKSNGVPRETGFEITAASEIMAVLALSTSLRDLRRRLGQLIVGVTRDATPITAEDIGAAGAMTVLLRESLMPNLVQTLEGTPLLVHAGPFGNLATGCNSVLADRIALQTSDYVVTEAGFGTDLGFEKFCHIVSPVLGKSPDVAVLVATVRALKMHSGKFKVVSGKPLPAELDEENLDALEQGAHNLKAHIDIVHRLGVPVVVAINRFPTDTEAELELLGRLAVAAGADGVAVSQSFVYGSEGGIALAEIVRDLCRHNKSRFQPLYPADAPLTQKIETIAQQVYGASEVHYEAGVRSQLKRFEKWGFRNLPICFAKTQFSLSHDPNLKGAPRGFTLPITDAQLASGAGFVRVLCGEMMTMPGLPAEPAARHMDIDECGHVTGMSW
ncbi:MAG: formate--tetrahydrofolate ligase [Armatimonadota bacterium]|nr:MAG: formate--tetrahydrofolate ligase [Armatimonadota bacterium]